MCASLSKPSPNNPSLHRPSLHKRDRHVRRRDTPNQPRPRPRPASRVRPRAGNRVRRSPSLSGPPSRPRRPRPDRSPSRARSLDRPPSPRERPVRVIAAGVCGPQRPWSASSPAAPPRCSARTLWRKSDASKTETSFQQGSQAIASTLKLAVQRQEELTVAASTFFAGNPKATSAEFARWVTWARTRRRYPELDALGLLPAPPKPAPVVHKPTRPLSPASSTSGDLPPDDATPRAPPPRPHPSTSRPRCC